MMIKNKELYSNTKKAWKKLTDYIDIIGLGGETGRAKAQLIKPSMFDNEAQLKAKGELIADMAFGKAVHDNERVEFLEQGSPAMAHFYQDIDELIYQTR